MRVWDAVQEALQHEIITENIAARDTERNWKTRDIIIRNAGPRAKHVRRLGTRESLLRKVSKLNRRRLTVEGRGKSMSLKSKALSYHPRPGGFSGGPKKRPGCLIVPGRLSQD